MHKSYKPMSEYSCQEW